MLRYYFEGYADAVHLATTLRSRPQREASILHKSEKRKGATVQLRRLWLVGRRYIRRARSP
jgi:hypothetical protein